MARRAGGRRGSAARWARTGAGAALLLVLARARAGEPGMTDVPVSALARAVQSNVRMAVTERGLAVDVEHPVALVFALQGAQELEVGYEASGILLLTYITVDPATGKLPDHRGPPYRYRRVAPGSGRLALDLRETAGWSARRYPYLLLEGSGRFTLTGLRYRPRPADDAAARAALDRAALLAPLAIGYTTVNLLYIPWWSESEGTFLYDRMGWAFVALAALAVLLALSARRALPLAWTLAAAALLATAASDAVFLSKLLPAVQLSLPLDPEARIRDNYHYAPKLGALAALARRTLPPEDRVAVRGLAQDWFAPEVLCFNLAPRRCATLSPGASEYVGPSQVDRLRPEEVDAVVSIDSDEPPPPGFDRVAEVSPNAYVARRR